MSAFEEVRIPAAPNWVQLETFVNMGAKPKTDPYVYRAPSNPNAASLLISRDIVKGAKATIFENGQGAIGWKFGDFGTYKASIANRSMARLGIPARYAVRVPFGRTPTLIREEGGLIVLDFNQFNPPA